MMFDKSRDGASRNYYFRARFTNGVQLFLDSTPPVESPPPPPIIKILEARYKHPPKNKTVAEFARSARASASRRFRRRSSYSFLFSKEGDRSGTGSIDSTTRMRSVFRFFFGLSSAARNSGWINKGGERGARSLSEEARPCICISYEHVVERNAYL